MDKVTEFLFGILVLMLYVLIAVTFLAVVTYIGNSMFHISNDFIRLSIVTGVGIIFIDPYIKLKENYERFGWLKIISNTLIVWSIILASNYIFKNLLIIDNKFIQNVYLYALTINIIVLLLSYIFYLKIKTY